LKTTLCDIGFLLKDYTLLLLNELPENLMDLFEIKNNINYNLRSNGNEFTLQKPKTNFMKKSISYNGAKTWNNLPRCVKTSDATIRQFKAALDRIKH
jgi:hypothetical protein